MGLLRCRVHRDTRPSVTMVPGGTLECCQSPRETVAMLHKLTFLLNVKANPMNTNVFICLSVRYSFRPMFIPSH